MKHMTRHSMSGCAGCGTSGLGAVSLQTFKPATKLEWAILGSGAYAATFGGFPKLGILALALYAGNKWMKTQ